MKDIKIIDSAMKTPGYIETKMVKCGKAQCKCAKGELHGPYFYYRYWKLYHRTWIQKKKYVTKVEAEKILIALKKYREIIYYAGEDNYRALRRGIEANIKRGVSGMTQRKLASVSAKMNSFLQ